MMKGITLLEVLIVILIFGILVAGTAPFFSFPKIEANRDIVYLLLNRARIKSLAGIEDDYWGVNIEQEKTTLFKGQSYQDRDIDFDKIYNISSEEEKEFVFEKITGLVQESGQVMDIQVSSLGIIFTENIIALERENIDSRRVLVYYNRVINQNEDIILNSDSFLIEDFLIDNNLYLEYDNVLIETLFFNNPNTIFSIKRDRRYNEGVLTIFLEQDPDFIIQYSADGEETNYQSLFIEEIIWE